MCSEIKTNYYPHLKRCGLISDIKEMEIKEFCSILADKTDDGLLNILAINEENANKFAKNVGLPKPFIKYKDNYLLNSRGDFK